MFEKKHQKMAPHPVFLKRMALYLGVSLILIMGVLLIGIVGYHELAGFSWIDSLLNASMIVGGMGQINPLTTDAAKLFASVYALFCGLVFIAAMGLILVPVMHRVLHAFHVENK